MNNTNNTDGSRIPLRQTYLRGRRHSRRKYRHTEGKASGFMVRFNITLTIVAALALLSRIDTDITKKLTSEIKNIISADAAFSEIKDKAAEVYSAFISDNAAEDVFSDSSDTVEKSITDKIEYEREMENSLKNQ